MFDRPYPNPLCNFSVLKRRKVPQELVKHSWARKLEVRSSKVESYPGNAFLRGNKQWMQVQVVKELMEDSVLTSCSMVQWDIGDWSPFGEENQLPQRLLDCPAIAFLAWLLLDCWRSKSKAAPLTASVIDSPGTGAESRQWCYVVATLFENKWLRLRAINKELANMASASCGVPSQQQWGPSFHLSLY